MKKLLMAFLAIAVFSTASFAQTTPKKNDKAATVAKTPVVKKETKETAKETAKATPATSTASHLKKDGSPDKRYKENKGLANSTAKHVKKDGTPDKRYKENKKN